MWHRKEKEIKFPSHFLIPILFFDRMVRRIFPTKMMISLTKDIANMNFIKKRAETTVFCLMRISKYGWQADCNKQVTSEISISFVSYTMTFTISASVHCYPWHKSIISIFRKFLQKVIESSFKCKFIFFASCARANETWKQCQWIMKTITCKLKSSGKITSFGGPI